MYLKKQEINKGHKLRFHNSHSSDSDESLPSGNLDHNGTRNKCDRDYTPPGQGENNTVQTRELRHQRRVLVLIQFKTVQRLARLPAFTVDACCPLPRRGKGNFLLLSKINTHTHTQ